MSAAVWSDADIDRVREMLNSGVHQREIAMQLGRTRRSLQGAITRYRIGLPSLVMRKGPVPTTPPVYRDPCPGCGVRMDADPAMCCDRGRALRRLVA